MAMNGVSPAVIQGWPAISVLRLSPARPVEPRASKVAAGHEALRLAVAYPPRSGQVQPLGALLPDVLARYELNSPAEKQESSAVVAGALDLTA
jgi:hypothetical protein